MHGRVAAVRTALLHSISSELAKTSAVIVIEDLNAAGMLKNKKLARHVSDAGFGELRRQLECKSAWYGTQLVVADRWFPSSKTCSRCGVVKADLTLADRVYECAGEHGCGLVIDRDLNAAINLARCTPPADEGTNTAPPLPAAA